MRALLLVLVLASAGCDLLLDPGGGSNEYAPRIDGSFPDAGVLELAAGSLTFSADGEDPDSLALSWTWSLDGEVQAAGTSDDGTFETGWDLAWDPAMAGATVEVGFAVSDGDLSADLLWTVDVR